MQSMTKIKYYGTNQKVAVHSENKNLKLKSAY